MSKLSFDHEEKRIISELTDEEITKALNNLLDMGFGFIPENVRLMTKEVLKRWHIRTAGE